MIDNWPILSIITFMPLAGVLFLLIIRGDDDTVAYNSRNVALWVSAFTFLVSLVTGRRGYTPLHFAALRGHNAVVDFLLGKLRCEDNAVQPRNR